MFILMKQIHSVIQDRSAEQGLMFDANRPKVMLNCSGRGRTEEGEGVTLRFEPGRKLKISEM